MFEDSLVESAGLAQTRKLWPVFLSLAAQFAAACAILALPLLRPDALPLSRSLTAALITPRPPAPAPPPHIRAVEHTSGPAPLRALLEPSTHAPVLSNLGQPPGPPVDAPTITTDMGMRGPSLPAALGSPSPSTTRVAVEQPAAKRSAAQRISSGISAGLLLAPLRPEYPAIARFSHTEGTVIVQATISRTGTVERAHVLSGPQLLQQSALEAVVHARYRPYLLNGKPTEVETNFTIRFRMGSDQN